MNKVASTISFLLLTIAATLIVMPFVYVSKTTSEAYEIPKSEVVLQGWTGMAAFATFKNAAKGTELDANESLNFQVNAIASKRIDFSVNAVNDTTGDVLATYLFYPDVSTLNIDWTVPLTSEYEFAFNSINLFTYEDASLSVTKQWTEIAYRDVTTEHQLLPFEFSYAGMALIILGVGIWVYGANKNKTSADKHTV
jgi:hypothetical protein